MLDKRGIQGFQLFSIKGIPVSVSWSFFILILLLASTAHSLLGGLIFAVVATLGIFLHELGHAIASKHYSLGPRIVLGGLGGITYHSPSSSNKKNIIISGAGPLVGLVLGGIFYAGFALMQNYMGASWLEARPLLVDFMKYMIWVNLGWGIFNLIPVLPMDGGNILRYILEFKCTQMRSLVISRIVSMVFGGVLLGVSVYLGSFFMIFFSLMMLVTNYFSYKQEKPVAKIYSGDADAEKYVKRLTQQRSNLKAESLYLHAESAARQHKWEELETLGLEMLKYPLTDEQKERAYELLVIAKTNLGDYQAALSFVPKAKKTEAVEQARQRCERLKDIHIV